MITRYLYLCQTSRTLNYSIVLFPSVQRQFAFPIKGSIKGGREGGRKGEREGGRQKPCSPVLKVCVVHSVIFHTNNSSRGCSNVNNSRPRTCIYVCVHNLNTDNTCEILFRVHNIALHVHVYTLYVYMYVCTYIHVYK